MDGIGEHYILMAHFALLDENNIVLRVEAVHNDCAPDEATGIAFLQSLYGGGNFVQCSYNATMRGRYPGVGYTYNGAVFYPPRPYPSWSLDANYDWQPPTPMPDDGEWMWDEGSLAWVAAT